MLATTIINQVREEVFEGYVLKSSRTYLELIPAEPQWLADMIDAEIAARDAGMEDWNRELARAAYIAEMTDQLQHEAAVMAAQIADAQYWSE